jgi:hypothetical protein
MLPRFVQATLIVSLVGLSWPAMMAVHELGHVLHALVSGGSVVRVVLHPLAISRTDVSPNPHPQFVAWGGAVWGTILPLALFVITRWLTPKYAYLVAFFAGFCAVANGLYLAGGSLSGASEAGDLLRSGAAIWQLLAFGLSATIMGLWLWNGIGPSFGLGVAGGKVDRAVAVAVAIAFVAVVVVELLLSGD